MYLTYGDLNLEMSGLFLGTLILAVLVLFFFLRKILRKKGIEKRSGSGLIGALFGSPEKVEDEYDFSDAKSYKDKKRKKTVAVVEISGIILDDPIEMPMFGKRMAVMSRNIKRLLKDLEDNKRILGILIRLTTPGGTVPGSEEIFASIAKCKKPIVIHIGSLCASGGVWAMVGAPQILASREALIGSIGVMGPTLHEYADVHSIKEGGLFGESVEAGTIKSRVLSVGDGKSLGNPFAPPSYKAIDRFRRTLERTYERFVDHVSKRRGIERATLVELGAAVVDADEALELKLIDAVGPYEDAEVAVAKLLECGRDDCHFPTFRESGKSGLSGLLAQHALSARAGTEMQQVNAALRGRPLLIYRGP